MFAILLIALCVVTAHAQYHSRYYSCPPDNLAVRQFRMMTSDLSPQEMPTVDQAQRDLYRAPKEIRDLAENSVSEALSYKKQFQLLIHPFVYRCCEKPFYNCSHVDIPLRFIWYQYSSYYYYNQFCFVIYPAGEKTIHYTKCTCMTCVRDSYCPIVGRCVETDYTYHYIIVYCPKLYYSYRYKILLVAVPRDCQCMTYCPYNYYGYGYSSRSALASTARAAAAPLSAKTAQPDAARSAIIAENADDDEGGSPEGSSESSGPDVPPPPEQEIPTQ